MICLSHKINKVYGHFNPDVLVIRQRKDGLFASFCVINLLLNFQVEHQWIRTLNLSLDDCTSTLHKSVIVFDKASSHHKVVDVQQLNQFLNQTIYFKQKNGFASVGMFAKNKGIRNTILYGKIIIS